MITERLYQRKTFRVQAVRVTVENMQELADWAGGEITAAFKESGDAEFCIQIVATWANGRKNKHKAFIGDWITRLTDANNFRIYKDKPFGEAFDELPSMAEKYESALEALRNLSQDIKCGAFGEDSEEAMCIGVAEELTELFTGGKS